ncbi:MAG: 4Fe-4S binding protein [Acidobacteriota bacterium]
MQKDKKKMRESELIIIEKESDMPPMAMSLGYMTYNKTGSWRNIKPIINYDICIDCMICWKFCPDACVLIENGRPLIDYDFCKGCGICAEECPKDCIEMVEEGK